MQDNLKDYNEQQISGFISTMQQHQGLTEAVNPGHTWPLELGNFSALSKHELQLRSLKMSSSLVKLPPTSPRPLARQSPEFPGGSILGS